MGWAGHTGSMGEIRNAYRILARNLEGSDHFGNLGIGGRISK
jgi:hypothetical protein